MPIRSYTTAEELKACVDSALDKRARELCTDVTVLNHPNNYLPVAA
jgi:hypothetical protein